MAILGGGYAGETRPSYGPGWPLVTDQVDLINELSGLWGASSRCWLVSQCWQLDVALCFRLLPPILQGLLTYCLWQENWSKWDFHKKVSAQACQVSWQIHLWALDCPTCYTKGCRVHYWDWLPKVGWLTLCYCPIPNYMVGYFSRPMVDHAVVSKENMAKMKVENYSISFK